MSRRQAVLIKQLRADLEVDRKLLRVYQLLYGKHPQEQQPLISGTSSTATTIIPPYQFCSACHRLENPLAPHQHLIQEDANGRLVLF